MHTAVSLLISLTQKATCPLFCFHSFCTILGIRFTIQKKKYCMVFQIKSIEKEVYMQMMCLKMC